MPQPTGDPGQQRQRVDVVVRADVAQLGGERKQALVFQIQPAGRKFTIVADEPEERGGEDSAPTPLSIFTAGVGF